MTVRCIDCQHMSRKDTSAELLRLGFARCAVVKLAVGRHHGMRSQRDCAYFSGADPADVAKRTAWLESKLSQKGGSPA